MVHLLLITLYFLGLTLFSIDDLRAFISLGLEPFHTVSVLGYPHPCQHISNMAAIHAGGFVGGMYQTNTEVKVTLFSNVNNLL